MQQRPREAATCAQEQGRGLSPSLGGWASCLAVMGVLPLTPFPLSSGAAQDGELYSGTSYNFLGSEPIISRNSSHSPLRTEYAIPWLNGKKQVPPPWCFCAALSLSEGPWPPPPKLMWQPPRKAGVSGVAGSFPVELVLL